MTDPIRAALERLISDIQSLSDSSLGIDGLHQNGDLAQWGELLEGGCYSSWLGDALAAARAALAAKPPLTDEQIRDLAEYEFKFERFDQVDQDKNETFVWECTDAQLIQFARFHSASMEFTRSLSACRKP